MRSSLCPIILALLIPLNAAAGPDTTSFQAAVPYAPDVDVGADMVMVYGVQGDFAQRSDEWKKHGYTIGMMTGISWGQYGAYYQTEDGLKEDEIQTDKFGKLIMHGNSTTVGYNVPSPQYVDFIKEYITPAIDYGVESIFLEEPEYWAFTGWSEGFKKEWQRFYNEPWQAPDSSPDAQWRASRLKYELYFNALNQVFAYIKSRAKEQGKTIECHVPTHSLINYAHWRIVSPMTRLMDIPEMDGYIAQVWTGTARTHHKFHGIGKERTLETAYFEYGQMHAMTAPLGKKLWFLADPIEDNPNYDWADYRDNYEQTIVASLFWPHVARYEVMPWPGRIFRGQYPLEKGKDERVPMPESYGTELLTVINALNDMDQDDIDFGDVTNGIGIIVSDSMMFQRAGPSPSDRMMGSFYGLAMPFLKAGVPIDPVQLETVICGDVLSRYAVLILSYENQKPLDPAYHDALVSWVRAGGALLYVGDGSDPYHNVRAWWNEEGKTSAKAFDSLFERLGVSDAAHDKPQQIDRGWVRVISQKARSFAESAEGAAQVRRYVEELMLLQGQPFKTSNRLTLRRGPYRIAAVFDESISAAEYELDGPFIDLFDPALPVIASKRLQPGEHALLYDLQWAQRRGTHVAAAAGRVRDEQVQGNRLDFRIRGPEGTVGAVRVVLPAEPVSVSTEPEITTNRTSWDAASSTLFLTFPHHGADIEFTIRWAD